jgi:hypothetical protein
MLYLEGAVQQTGREIIYPPVSKVGLSNSALARPADAIGSRRVGDSVFPPGKTTQWTVDLREHV